MAGDSVYIQLPKGRVKEDSAFTATAYFRTRSTGVAATPTNVKYRIDCLTTGAEIADWTSVSAASSVSISITATHNAIQNDSNQREVKQLTVALDHGLSTQHTETATWIVENVYGFT